MVNSLNFDRHIIYCCVCVLVFYITATIFQLYMWQSNLLFKFIEIGATKIKPFSVVILKCDTILLCTLIPNQNYFESRIFLLRWHFSYFWMHYVCQLAYMWLWSQALIEFGLQCSCCVTCKAERHIGITLPSIRMSIRLCVCLVQCSS